MDGRIARLLNSTSMFGAQLDSLSDFLCFGIAPPFVLYMWKLHEIQDVGWAVVLFFSVCCALRLARFNTSLTEEREPWQMKFFVGIPSPAGAMLALLPIVSSFYAPMGMFGNVFYCICWVSLVALLMASKVPTYAAKRIRIHHEWLLPTMLGCVLVMVFVFIEPWVMFTLVGTIYCLFIPISMRRYSKLAAIHKQAVVSPEDESALSL
jgi:CDP-diacylglycerol--serine O-phosphatidyltransferase